MGQAVFKQIQSVCYFGCKSGCAGAMRDKKQACLPPLHSTKYLAERGAAQEAGPFARRQTQIL